MIFISQSRFMAILLAASLLLLSSCSYFLPHKIDIQQGNILEQESVNKLKPGMRKDQVQFILGTPMLMDMFHANRWDYIYTLQQGHNKMQKTRLTLHFKDDELFNIVGDMKPGEIIENKVDKSKVISVPLEDYVPGDGLPWYSWLMWWKDDKTQKAVAGEPEPSDSTQVSEIIEERKNN